MNSVVGSTSATGGVAMDRFIGTIGVGVVVFGDGLPHGVMADESGFTSGDEPVIWDCRYMTPSFHVIGYAADQHQAVEIAHEFARGCGLPFAEFDGTSAWPSQGNP
jgi:hypothetical protein